MAYTPNEIQESVEKIVLNTIPVTYDTLGVRRNDIAFSQIQQAAAGVFMTYYNAPFYVCWLGAQKTGELVQGEVNITTSLETAIRATGRRVLPITNLNPLNNAKAALFELEGAAGQRDKGFKDISRVPAFQRFSANISQFLGETGGSIKQNGDIVPTPQEAQGNLAGLVTQLNTSHTELVRRVGILAGAMADYQKMNLPALVAQGVISRSRQLLDQRSAELSALSETARLNIIRSVILDVLSSQTLVAQFDSGVAVTPFFTVHGSGAPYSDASHLATAAIVFGDIGGPYSIISTNAQLDLYLDGSSSPTSVFMPESYTATLEGQIAEPFALDSLNNELKLRIGTTDILVELHGGPPSSHSAVDEAERIATALLPDGRFTAEAYFAPLRFSGLLTITGTGPFTFTCVGDESLSGLGISTSDFVLMKTGLSAGVYGNILSVAGDFKSFTADGPFTEDPLQETGEIGDQYRRVRIKVIDPAAALAARTEIMVVGDSDIHNAAARCLGFLPNVTAISRRTNAQEIVDYLGGQTSAARFASTYVPNRLAQGPARTDPTVISKVIFSRLQATGTITAPGTSALFSLGNVAGAVVGAQLVIRNSVNLADVNKTGIITAIDAEHATITATMSSAVSVGSVDIEVGTLFLSTPQLGDLIHIHDGSNLGDYYVESMGPLNFEFTVSPALPLYNELNQPIVISASMGQQSMSIASAARTVSSKINVQGAGRSLLFTAAPTATGTTPWFKLPEVVKGLSSGDTLAIYRTQYNVPTSEHVISSINSLILGLATEMDSTISLINFSTEVPVPFARLRVGHVAEYSMFSGLLTRWLGQSAQQLTQWFQDFNRYINPLVVNTSPTPVQVQDTLTKLEELTDQLADLAVFISVYSVSHVPEVDTLIRTFRDKGGDRAADLLTEGQFSTFFGLDMHDSSYAGAFMKSVRTVALNDMPVRKVGRADLQNGRLISSGQSPDYEYDSSDIDPTREPDTASVPD